MANRTVEQIYDEWLVIRCQGGDKKAMTQLIGRWQNRIRVYVWRMTDGHDDAVDISQEIWIKVFKKLKRLQDPACFPQWIYKIATTSCADWVRKKRRDRRLSKSVAEENVIDESIPDTGNSGDDIQILKRALRQLPPDSKAIISLFYLDELSSAAIAESLGIPVGTVKSRLHSARELLKKTIDRSK